MNTASARLAALRGSTTKIRLVLNQIRGKDFVSAQAILKFSNRRPSEKILRLLNDCRANFEKSHGKIDESRLIVNQIYCTKGPTLKRFRAKSMGRAGKILKKTSNLNIELVAV
jgi:large subunit ribosomal protein L22